VNIIRGKREDAEAGLTDGVRSGTLGRRSVLGGLAGGLAALPVLSSVGSATPALAATAVRSGSVPTAAGDLVRGVERRYNAPLLTPGTRLVLPAGIKAVPIKDYYHHPHFASAESAWPHMTAADGTTVDASVVPDAALPPVSRS
jgi:hypothetical protein